MRAWRFHRYGGPEVLQFEEAPKPSPAEGEILVRVGASSVNPVDWRMREGLVRGSPATFPRIVGRDCAGIVEQSNSAAFRPGDRVVATNNPAKEGTHADYAAVPAANAARIPDSVSDIDAVAIGNSGVTAWDPIVEIAKPRAGMRFLIHTAAGGVGSIAVQLARRFGAEVIATTSTRNLDYVRSLGAQQAIDYTREDFVAAAGPCDVVFDAVGGETYARSFDALKPGGLLVRINAAPIDPMPPRTDVRVELAQVKRAGEYFAQLMALVEQGALKPHVQLVVPFEKAPKAYAASQTGRSRGKNVIEIRAARAR